jgi:hypothetical protein
LPQDLAGHVRHGPHFEPVEVVETDLDSALAAERMPHRWGAGMPVTVDLTKQARKECPISVQNRRDDSWFCNIGIRRLEEG